MRRDELGRHAIGGDGGSGFAGPARSECGRPPLPEPAHQFVTAEREADIEGCYAQTDLPGDEEVRELSGMHNIRKAAAAAHAVGATLVTISFAPTIPMSSRSSVSSARSPTTFHCVSRSSATAR